jgi:predicted flap endonuclease-1-like 5' DNA nuclease
MAKLIDIEGIGEAYLAKLTSAGVSTIENLLEKGASPKGRKELEDATGIRHDLILEWINHADLFRVDGIGSEYSDLLEAAGVDTVAELAQRNAENLYNALSAKNEEKNLVRRLPSQKQVSDWIDCAKGLPKIVTY